MWLWRVDIFGDSRLHHPRVTLLVASALPQLSYNVSGQASVAVGRTSTCGGLRVGVYSQSDSRTSADDSSTAVRAFEAVITAAPPAVIGPKAGAEVGRRGAVRGDAEAPMSTLIQP